jgi:hypothetical protein
MILLALAAAATAQWTGPPTVEYRGPGNFCGGGYRVLLARGDRALVLPQDTGSQGVRLVLAGREVNVLCGWLPRCKWRFDVPALVGCSLVSGLLMRPFSWPLALMVSANLVPLCFAGLMPSTLGGVSRFPV